MTGPDKCCVQCGETKPRSEFYRRHDGWQARCKPCDNRRRSAGAKYKPRVVVEARDRGRYVGVTGGPLLAGYVGAVSP